MKILVANIGSTSFKYRLFDMPTGAVLAEGRAERIGQGGDCPDYRTAIERAIGAIVGPANPSRLWVTSRRWASRRCTPGG